MSHQNPAVAARRDLVGLLLMKGFTISMVCDAMQITKITVNNDKNIRNYRVREDAFAPLVALWLHWKREGTLGADLEVRIASDAELRVRIIAVLTQGVMAELNPAVVPLLRGIFPVLEDGGPYEWLFTGLPKKLVPPMEELWAQALNAGNRAPPATLEEAVLCFTQYMTVKYVQSLALATPDDEDRTVQVKTPAYIRKAMDGLLGQDQDLWHRWGRWLRIHDMIRAQSTAPRDRARHRPLVREERRLRLQILDACTSASSEIAAFRNWLELGPQEVDVLFRNLRQQVADFTQLATDASAALQAANGQLLERGIEPVSQDAVPASVIPGKWWKRMDEIALSVRSANCLQRAGIEYIWQLIEKSEAEMLKIKNFGRKSLNEIKEILDEFGLRFGTKITTIQRHVLEGGGRGT